tara:strand:- start:354 stop:488 length:135 start_codon:yes stop_codon:yes gene_type:complete
MTGVMEVLMLVEVVVEVEETALLVEPVETLVIWGLVVEVVDWEL